MVTRAIFEALRSEFVTLYSSLQFVTESSREHLPTRIAEVLRLRAMSPSVWNRSARRCAQDDGFVEEVEHICLVCDNTERPKKSQALSRQAGGRQDDGFAVAFEQNIW